MNYWHILEKNNTRREIVISLELPYSAIYICRILMSLLGRVKETLKRYMHDKQSFSLFASFKRDNKDYVLMSYDR